jgi:hypothetical protein
MALTVIDEPSFGGRLGSAVGSGLGGLLENLVQRKAQQVQQNQRALGYEKSFGLAPDQAKILSQQPEEFQQIALKSLIDAQQIQQFQREINPDQYGTQSLGSLGMQQPQQPSLENAMQQGLSTAPQDAIQMALQKGLPKLLQQEQQLGKAAVLPQERPVIAPVKKEEAPKGRTIKDIISNKPLSPQLAAKAEELKMRRELHKEKLSAQEQREASKETHETYVDTNKKAQGAKESNMRLDRIEHLLDKGKVQDNIFIRSLDTLSDIKYVGKVFDVIGKAITNTDTQEFKKLSTDFIRDAKQFFGNRLTEQEALVYLQTVPSLSQTNEGKRRIIRNMRIFNETALLKKKAMDDIIKKNGGKRPPNLDILIEDQIGDKLDQLATKFKEGAVSGKKGALGTLANIAFPSLS